MSDLKKQDTINMDRRKFLKIGGAAVGAAGIAAVASTPVAKATQTSRETEVLTKGLAFRQEGFKGAKVRRVDYPGGIDFDINHLQQADLKKGTFLGTTEVVGEVKRVRERDGGFPKLFSGEYGPTSVFIEEAGPQYSSPNGTAYRFVTAPFGAEKYVDGEPDTVDYPLPGPEDLTRHIKDFCFNMGVDDVGIGVMPVQGFYSVVKPKDTHREAGITDDVPVENDHPLAITLICDQGFKTTVLSSDGYDGGQLGATRAYFKSTVYATMLAKYIRILGYRARAHHNRNYQLITSPVTIACGMGELCRAGDSVLHPYLGFNTKLSVVTTDMPLIADRPIDFGLQEFCRVCKKCAEECPSNSISLEEDKSEYNGYLKWKLDAKSCAIFRAYQPDGFGCGRCAVVCPWTSKEESWFHSMASYAGSLKIEPLNKIIRDMDDICGYGTEVSDKYKWWLGFPGLG